MSNTMRSFFYDFKKNVDLELPSRKRLLKRLGEYDTLAEYTFCAIRDFEANWNGEISFEDYVTSKARLRDVNLRGGVMLPNHEISLIKSFLVNSHAMLEDFIEYYKNDIRNLIDPEFHLDGSDGLSKAQKLLVPLSHLGIEPNFPSWLLPTLTYYRLLRNSAAHNEKEVEKLKEAYDLIDRTLLYEQYPIFAHKAPNFNTALTIDDLYFYSACIKHFANYLTMALKGKVEWNKLGETHENFDVRNFKKGTKPIPLITVTLGMYNHKATKEEVLAILAHIKEQKEILREEKSNARKLR